jgi:DNA-binding NarL/FixJ family response regulator
MIRNGIIRVLVVDDHFVVRAGLVSSISLEPDIQVIGEASTGAQALELVRKLRPDLVLLDLRLPDMSGTAVAQQLRAEFPDARIIMLSTFDASELVYRALQAGARSYLQKNCQRDELLQAIRTVHAGGRHLAPAAAMGLAERLNRPELTPREIEVLRLIAAGRINKEVGAELGITEITVKLHVRSILGKLGVNDRTQAVTTALRLGILEID